MSYRELRNFKEIMATLGYPRLISIENFKVPHFELVADILIWLCQRYDKNMDILDEITTEQDRVVFLKAVAEQLLVKARIKLNLKNLYSANGFAVRELLKLASMLHAGHRDVRTPLPIRAPLDHHSRAAPMRARRAHKRPSRERSINGRRPRPTTATRRRTLRTLDRATSSPTSSSRAVSRPTSRSKTLPPPSPAPLPPRARWGRSTTARVR